MSFRLILRSCKVVSREEAPSKCYWRQSIQRVIIIILRCCAQFFPRRSDTNKKLANGPLTCKQYHQKRYLEKFITGEKNQRSSVITVHCQEHLFVIANMRRWKSHFRMYLFHFVGFLALTNLFGKSLDTAHRYNGYIEDQLICKDSLIAFFSSSLTYICLRYNCRCRDSKNRVRA